MLATLLLNATTIGALVHRLGLDAPSRTHRFLAAVARLRAAQAARTRLDELGVQDEGVADRLGEVERAARKSSQPAAARTLLHEVDDHIEEVGLGARRAGRAR